jgi:hypothetical protein
MATYCPHDQLALTLQPWRRQLLGLPTVTWLPRAVLSSELVNDQLALASTRTLQ